MWGAINAEFLGSTYWRVFYVHLSEPATKLSILLSFHTCARTMRGHVPCFLTQRRFFQTRPRCCLDKIYRVLQRVSDKGRIQHFLYGGLVDHGRSHDFRDGWNNSTRV